MSKPPAKSTPIRVLIVDDNQLIRAALRQFLTASGIEIAGEVDKAQDAMAASSCLQPDIILMDIELPDGNGIDLTAKIKEAGHPARIIMFTSHDSVNCVWSALSAGALGFCIKGVNLEMLLLAVEAVHSGALWVYSPTANRVLANHARLQADEVNLPTWVKLDKPSA